jgi:hypothetical protein
MNTLRALLLLAVLGMELPQAALAHATSTSYLTLQAADERAPIELRWDLSLIDLASTIDIDANLDDSITWGEITAAQSGIARLVSSSLLVQRGAAPCTLEQRDLPGKRRAQHREHAVFFSRRFATGAAAVGWRRRHASR